MSFESFIRAYLLATYVCADPEKRSQMLKVAEAEDDGMYEAFKATGLKVQESLMYEDELPEMTDDEYSDWYKTSQIVDGVRMGRRVER